MTILPRTPSEEPFVALFTIDVRPERREDFLAAMEKAMAESAKEPGVLSFMLLTDRDDPNRFTAVDLYRDRTGYDAHLVAPQTAWLVAALDGCLVAPPQGSLHHKLCDRDDFLVGNRPNS
jgi:quinol monooxygenase YgiN